MKKLEIIRDLLGDSTSDFVADTIKDSYLDLLNEVELINTGKDRCPIWSYENIEELEEISKMMEAMKVVYGWFSCESIDSEK